MAGMNTPNSEYSRNPDEIESESLINGDGWDLDEIESESLNEEPDPLNHDPLFDLEGPNGSRAISCDICGGFGQLHSMDGVSQGECHTCEGQGIVGVMFTIPAPTIKPVKKRKTGKMYQRNPMLNANDTDHWRVTAPIKKEWRRRGRGWGNRLRLRSLGWQHVHIDAYINRPIRNNSDAANFHPTMKPIMDGLIDAGLLPDDNDNHLQGPYLHKGEHAPYSITVKITRMENPE